MIEQYKIVSHVCDFYSNRSFHYKVRVGGSSPPIATYVVLTAIHLDITANYENQKHHEKIMGHLQQLIS